MSSQLSSSQFLSFKPRKRQRPSFHRGEDIPSFQITHRDQQIILRVAYYHLLSTHHIEALLFHTPNTSRTLKSQCQRRLQLLYHHRFLNRIQQPVVLGEGRKPFIYTLDQQGVRAVAQLLDISTSEVGWNPKLKYRNPYRLPHDLHISNTWVILDRLTQSRHLQMPYWLTQRHLKSAQIKDKLPSISLNGGRKIKEPDGYFALQFPQASDLAHFFYEEDRGTQSQRQWTEKIQAYIGYKKTGDSFAYFGFNNFRVLTKTTTPKRLANLKAWTEKAGGNEMFWFTNVGQIDIWQPQTLLQPIWQVSSATGAYSLTLTDTITMQS
ncbi:MAG: replication-relaxation family protein [Caldilineaceae bacterium]|nr:replication-relaxation family protein [Caldilineaceae bacterium]